MAQGASGGGGIAGIAGAAVVNRTSARPGGFVANAMWSVNRAGLRNQHAEAQEMEEVRPLAGDREGYGREHGRDYQDYHSDWQVQTPPQPLSAPPELGHERTSGTYFGYDAARDLQDTGSQNVHGLETQHLLDRKQPRSAQAAQQLSASSEVHPYLRTQQAQQPQEPLPRQGPSTSPPRETPAATTRSIRRPESVHAPNEQAVPRPGASGSIPARPRGVLQRSNVVMHTHM